MAPHPEQKRAPRAWRAAAALGLALWVLLLLLVLRLPPDGREHGDLGQWVGRFHPLLVHGPVALVVLVAAMELAGLVWARSDLRSAAGWILAVAAAGALAAALDGWLLAWSGGYRGRDVTRHRWGGVWLAPTCAAALWARSGFPPGRAIPGAYPVFLALAVGLMVWTGHGGGAISHGSGFLTDKMPARLRPWLGLPALVAKAAPEPVPSPVKISPGGPPGTGVHSGAGTAEPSHPAYYRLHIAPLFVRSCVSCHKAEKHKGGLRMDSYERLMSGGEDGAVVAPGNPQGSDLVRRLKLPVTDDDSMPGDGEKPLTTEEIQMIERWIAAGAKNG